MNKKVFLVALTALACLGLSARADDISSPRTVTGHGVSSDANPSCGDAPGEAEQDADQDALSQCKTAGIQRISDYTISSNCFAHGLYGVSHASAEYQCVDGSSPLDRRFVGQAESQGDCGPVTDIPALIASTQAAALENARKQCRGGNIIQLSDYTDNHYCTPLNVNCDRHLEVIESAVFLCGLAH